MKLRYGTPEEVGISAERIAHIARLAESWVEEGITPALVVLAARRGVVVLHDAFGRLTPEPDAPPLQRDSIFPVSSITKPVTATAVMQLVENGLLGLNRPLQDYIPEFMGEGKEAVMVHHLLTHTSGLDDPDPQEFRRILLDTAYPPSPESTQHAAIGALLTRHYADPLARPPGAAMSYVNLNYLLLGEVVRRVSGHSLWAFMQDRIFAPLGMNDSSLLLTPEAERRIVKRSATTDAVMFNRPPARWLPAPAGGLTTTAMDLAIFGQTFLNGGHYGNARILSPAAVAEMTRNQIPGIPAKLLDEVFAEASWGYGWDVQSTKKPLRDGSLKSAASFGHGGFGGCYFWVDPTYEMVGVFLSVQTYEGPRVASPRWRGDYFVNAVTAAVIDVR
jgi:CubicO group peptidase (beta-lactamase class C family)